jgi:predicted kinase
MSKKLTLYLTKGLPGSGKSTWAKSMIDKSKGQIVNVCKDDLRFMLRNGESSKATEKFVKEIRDFITKEAINKGCSVIWSDTNLHPSHELRAKELVKELDIRFEIKDFTEVPLETCIAQDLKRFNSVGEKVIMKMYNEFLKPQKVINHLEQNKALPKAIICDLDGTLSLFKDIYNGLDENGKPIYLNLRNPYDASTSDKDLLNEPVANVIRQFFKAKYEIIFLSGRLETYRTATEKFLKKLLKKII